MKRILILVLALVVLAIAITLLAQSWRTTSQKPVVAASIFPLADIVQNIAGDTLTVKTILPPNGNPHTFEPTPSDVKTFAQAHVFYKIGSGLDDWIDPLVKNASESASQGALGFTQITLKTVSDGINLLSSQDPDEGSTDPHYWMSAKNAQQIARTIAADLSVRFPEYAETFAINRDVYLQKLEETDAEIRVLLAPVKNRNMITMHDAWYYFADAYGLTIAGSFEPTGGKEPTPQYLTNLTAAVLSSDVHVIYLEPQSSEQAIRAFAQDNNLRIAELDDLGGMQGKMSYIDLLLTNARTIAQNQ